MPNAKDTRLDAPEGSRGEHLPAFFVTSRMMVSALLALAMSTPEGLTKTYRVAGVDRTALVYAPYEKSPKPPLVFVFHGHGGGSAQVSRSMDLHNEWPEAVVVYMQGLPTKTPNDEAGNRAGWQIAPGQEGDRDLKFFDSVYADLVKEFKVDRDRVYAAGHSNGARFCYVLWAERGDKFAAFAPSSSGGLGLLNKCKPKPAFLIGGKSDGIVDFRSIKLSLEGLKRINGCGEPKEWAKGYDLYPSDRGDLVTLFHEGGHTYQRQANPEIVRFFKAHPRKG